MIGSLISVRLCPSHATKQPAIAANKHGPPFAEGMRWCVFDGGVHLFGEHMSSLQVSRVEDLLTGATDASADGGLSSTQATIAKHVARRAGTDSRKRV